MQRRSLLTFAATPLVAAPVARAAAQTPFPTRPIRLIVPYPPGGGVDIATRILAEPLAKHLGQQVVVENRSGAAGAIGVEAMALAAPDGHTLCMVAPGPLTVGPNLRPHPYDPLALTHVLRVVGAPLILIARPNLPATDVASLVQMVRARPEGVRFASGGAGTGTHLTGELFPLRAGGRMLHVPYRGAAPAISDLIAGQVDIYFSDTSALSFVRQGQVKALGVTTRERWPGLPDTPALSESLDGFDISNWNGVSAPPGTPPAIVARLDQAFRAALTDPEVLGRLQTTGFGPSILSGAAFDVFIRAESAAWAEVIRAANIRIDS